MSKIDTRTEAGRFVVHYEGICQGIQAARPIAKQPIVSKLERHSVSNQYSFHMGLQVHMGGAANVEKRLGPGGRVLVEGDDPYLVRDVIEPASSQGPAPRAGRPRPV